MLACKRVVTNCFFRGMTFQREKLFLCSCISLKYFCVGNFKLKLCNPSDCEKKNVFFFIFEAKS